MVKGSVVLLDDTFPHGTIDGYDRGCKGGHCPAAIPCRDVKRRYGSDLDFRRLLDAGYSLEAIREHDQEAAAQDVEAERRRRRGLPDTSPVTLDAADAAAARRTKPSPPTNRPSSSVEPVSEVLAEVVQDFVAEAGSAIGSALDAMLARPRKWQVRKVLMAIAPDGSAHGPFPEGQEQALLFVSAQFPINTTAPTAAGADAAGRRTRRPWGDADTARATLASRASWTATRARSDDTSDVSGSPPTPQEARHERHTPLLPPGLQRSCRRATSLSQALSGGLEGWGLHERASPAAEEGAGRLPARA